MSVFNKVHLQVDNITKAYVDRIHTIEKDIFECLEKFGEEYAAARSKARVKDKIPIKTLQSINEDEDDPPDSKNQPKIKTTATVDRTSVEDKVVNGVDEKKQDTKQSGKNDGNVATSPEQKTRGKRNASVKAQSIISQQVNVNLTQKMRRDSSTDKSRGRRKKDEDKENFEPIPNIQIKEEKLSVPPEPMETDVVVVKQELDEMVMPPPMAPVPKSRRAAPKEKSQADVEEEKPSRRTTTRTRKQTDTAPPPVAAPRSTRSARYSSRATKQSDEDVVPPEPRPKRTRAKRKVSESTNSEPEENQTSETPASPGAKPRPKRTRRGQKAAEKQESLNKDLEKPKEPEKSEPEPQKSEIRKTQTLLSVEKTQHGILSPILLQKITNAKNKSKTVKEPAENGNQTEKTLEASRSSYEKVKDLSKPDSKSKFQKDVVDQKDLDKTVKIGNSLDQTVVLPNGVYDHVPVTPKNIRNMNETMVIETNRDIFNNNTVVIEKQHNIIMDATVVIDKVRNSINITADDSILTDDNSDAIEQTPPKIILPNTQPKSAVKEKVQHFEELGKETRVTRTKTRAMAKKLEEEEESHTPPDKIAKPVLSAETLTKMNSMIFNGKPPQISTSVTKPRANLMTAKSFLSASASKVTAVAKAKEMAEESLNKERECARKKKEAMLEAKREQQKRKREEKMAAAAAAREAAERERQLALQAAARERLERQAHADLGKLERAREAERKKQELARKVAETEERRRAEEQARQMRLAEEQKRAEEARRKQLQEAEAMRKEEAIMTKEIEKRQKEYLQKQKMKKRMENEKYHTPLRNYTVEPVYMEDGFQYLNSDEDADVPDHPIPAWSTSKARRQQLFIQTPISRTHIDKLFPLCVYSPDLREIFPNIERKRLVRTSSAVWRTPPNRLPNMCK